MGAEVWAPLSSISLWCPGNAGGALGILQAGERRDRVRQSLFMSK